MSKIRHLDRRVAQTSGSFDGSITTWTLPYSVAVNGSEGEVVVVDRDAGTVLTGLSRPSATAVAASGDHSSTSVWIGIAYTSEVQLSQFYYQTRTGRLKTNGRTVLRYADVLYRDTSDLDATVATTGVTGRTLTIDDAAAGDGQLRLPLFALNDYLTITLGTSTPGSFSLLGVLWEGDRITRSRRNY